MKVPKNRNKVYSLKNISKTIFILKILFINSENAFILRSPKTETNYIPFFLLFRSFYVCKFYFNDQQLKIFGTPCPLGFILWSQDRRLLLRPLYKVLLSLWFQHPWPGKSRFRMPLVLQRWNSYLENFHKALPTSSNLQKRVYCTIKSVFDVVKLRLYDQIFLHCELGSQVWNNSPLKPPFNSTACSVG